jgi:hypothetical protein
MAIPHEASHTDHLPQKGFEKTVTLDGTLVLASDQIADPTSELRKVLTAALGSSIAF